MNSSHVIILMATYNGAKYLEAQLSSIKNQTMTAWSLLIRDDGSTDNTLDIIAAEIAKDPRIRLIEDSGASRVGAAENFGHLMEAALGHSAAQIFFFCDQDDVWENCKLERLMAQFPQGGCENFPLLVHSDLSVVDECLDEVHSSLFQYMALDTESEKPLNSLLTRNFVTGAAMACNRLLLEQSGPIPPAAIMHDWWLALVAAAAGEIRCLAEPLVKYRQHGLNTIGATGFWHLLSPRRNWLQVWQIGNAEFRATFEQARALSERARISRGWEVRQVNLIDMYLGLPKLPPVERLRRARTLKLRQGGLLIQCIYYFRLLYYPASE
ncbi:MAG: glycosyltransferase family 2 protein [Halioglobus sp.]